MKPKIRNVLDDFLKPGESIPDLYHDLSPMTEGDRCFDVPLAGCLLFSMAEYCVYPIPDQYTHFRLQHPDGEYGPAVKVKSRFVLNFTKHAAERIVAEGRWPDNRLEVQFELILVFSSWMKSGGRPPTGPTLVKGRLEKIRKDPQPSATGS